jgi:hypothetical protein
MELVKGADEQIQGRLSLCSRGWISLMIVAGVYLLVRAYPLWKATPELAWETLQAKKLEQYGFWQRHGAVLQIRFSFGQLAHPERFNYSHQPYPALWLIAAVHRFLGPTGVLALILVLGLVICLLTCVILRIFYDPLPALISAGLVAASPVFITFTTEASPYGLGGVLWLIGATLVGDFPSKLEPRPVSAWLLALTVFIAGQIDYFGYLLVPGLLAMSAIHRPTIREMLRANLRNPWWKATLIGAVLSGGLFGLQVIYFEPSLGEFTRYLHGLSSTTHKGFAPSYLRNLVAVPLRSFALLGMPLLLGLLAALWFSVRQRRMSPLLTGAAWYLACGASLAVFSPYFFVREQWVYTHAIFPLACFSAWALQQLKRAAAFWITALLVLPGVAYVQMRASIPVESRGSQPLAALLVQQVPANALVLTNFRPQEFPFPAWDQAVCDCAAARADRLLFCDIDSIAAFEGVLRQFGNDLPPVFFLKQSGAPIERELDERLTVGGRKILRTQLVFPPEIEGWALRLRSFYWRLQGMYQQLTPANSSNPGERMVSVELYRLQ